MKFKSWHSKFQISKWRVIGMVSCLATIGEDIQMPVCKAIWTSRKTPHNQMPLSNLTGLVTTKRNTMTCSCLQSQHITLSKQQIWRARPILDLASTHCICRPVASCHHWCTTEKTLHNYNHHKECIAMPTNWPSEARNWPLALQQRTRMKTVVKAKKRKCNSPRLESCFRAVASN